MKTLAELRDPGRLRGLLFDIDDTLTTDGQLTAEAYGALTALKRSGRVVVPITGRPAGWCDQIARLWPVDAVVGENGAFYFSYTEGKLQQCFQDTPDVRARNRGRLQAIGERILKQVPGCALASDQPYRATDLAIDYCEDVPALPLEAARRIAELMRAEGLNAKISSIHVNGWFGSYDKLGMSRRLFAERFGIAAEVLQREFAFAGDSPNDAPMFAFFENSVGVANVVRYAGILEAEPKYVTQGFAGSGFAELARHLLGAG
jgi:HAD superfamily hydrolase (TIGR01484 family)